MLFTLFIPFIPLLAFLAIGGGVITLIWYSSLSTDEKEEANERALKQFGKRFNELADEQQKKIKDDMG